MGGVKTSILGESSSNFTEGVSQGGQVTFSGAPDVERNAGVEALGEKWEGLKEAIVIKTGKNKAKGIYSRNTYVKYGFGALNSSGKCNLLNYNQIRYHSIMKVFAKLLLIFGIVIF